VAILGISPQPPEHGRQLRERVIQDAHFDQAGHKGHDAFWPDPGGAFPLRLISDPDCTLSRAVGAERKGHWSGPMVYATTFLIDAGGHVRWSFQARSASRRPSPVRLANMAGAVTKKEPLPDYVEE
jgi:hypothetical protein